MQLLELNKMSQGEALKMLKRIPDKSVQCIVTSPPYWAKRDYKVKGQIGMEITPQRYINRMMKIWKECWRVLKDNGVFWLNIGDTYQGGKGMNGASVAYSNAGKRLSKNATIATAPGIIRPNDRKQKGLKAKDLVGIPWMMAFALRKQGWYLRQENIWYKPNAHPESVKDRCTLAHESLFLFTKSRKYYYDYKAIQQPAKDSTIVRMQQNITDQKGSNRNPLKDNGPMKAVGNGEMANKKSVWTVPTIPFKEDHYATYPADLIRDCIKAGSRPGDTVLDPFGGAGTTAMVAEELERNWICIELSEKTCRIANRRLHRKFGMFKK